MIKILIVTLPLKNGTWRNVHVSEQPYDVEGTVWLSPKMMSQWAAAYRIWWEKKGNRLAISPEMWM